MKIDDVWLRSGELVALPDTKYLCSSQLWRCLCCQWDPATAWILWSTAGGRAGRRLLGPRLFRTWENWPRRRRRVWPETSRSSPWYRMRPSLLSRHSLGKKWTWRKKFGKSFKQGFDRVTETMGWSKPAELLLHPILGANLRFLCLKHWGIRDSGTLNTVSRRSV